MSGDSKSNTVSFSVTEARFDLETYSGRVSSIAAGTNFLNAFKTTG